MEAQSHPRSKPVVLITRPSLQAAGLAQAIENAYPGKWHMLISPLIEIRPLNDPVDLSDVHTLLFTSGNAVKSFAGASKRRDIPALCAGDKAFELATEYGLAARTVAQDAAGLADVLRMRPNPPNSKKFLHLRGRHQTVDIASALRANGIPARDQVIYEQIAQDLPQDVLSRIASGEIHTITLFSPRTAKLLAEQLADVSLPKEIRLLCLSEAIASPVSHLNLSTIIAKTPKQSSLLKLL